VPPLPVSAVVVNLDGGRLLFEALDALVREGTDEIVVVDNGSSAEEVDRIEKREGVRLFRLSGNRGFAGPANLGVHEARHPFVALVNNDCVVQPGYLEACAEALAADPSLAAVQGVVLDGESVRVDGWGIGWSIRAEAIQLGHGEIPPAPGTVPFPVPGVSATAALFRREAFLSAGGFAESFFAWYEDADLALRLRRAGARFACVPAARARHSGTATGRRDPRMRWRRLFTNRIRTLRRNFSPGALPALRLLRPAAGVTLGPAAAELGWTETIRAAFSASAAARRFAREDRLVLESLPPLTELPA
jgi:GT2 family glycosyltransferase